MNGYIALKNVVFNGIGYTAGSLIPAEAVLPSRVPALLRNGTIADATEREAAGVKLCAEEAFAPEAICLPIHTENGVQELFSSPADVAAAVEFLQLKKEDMISVLSDIVSEDVLIIADACTKATDVKKAIRKRAEELHGDGEA